MVKQVIVMRTDLNMRKGKMVAQGAHASVGALLQLGATYQGVHGIPLIGPVKEWIEDAFTKICVGVPSLQELDRIEANARSANLNVYRVIDIGATEFNGVNTTTCIAIGPAEAVVIDVITGGLKLL